MRLTLFDSRRNADLPLGDPLEPSAGAVGVEDENWYQSWLGGGPDVNPELTGSQKFHVYDEMMKSDASVKGMMQFWMLPVRSAHWGLNPAAPDSRSAPDAQAVAIRDAVNQQFGIEQQDASWLDLSWKELLGQGMRELLGMGCCIEEYIWGELRTWRDADGDAHPVRPLSQIAIRPARTIARVNLAPGGLIESVEQLIAGTTAIPKSKLSYQVWERDGRRWEGISMLRAAWGPWTLKKNLMIAAGIGWDRFAAGIPVIWHPNNPEAEEVAKDIGRRLRQHEEAYLHFPTDGAGMSGRPESEWFAELLNGSGTLADPTPLLGYFTDQIYECGMLQFARQGFGQTGARATSETQIDPYFLAVQELADYVRLARSRQAIRRFVEVNFGTEMADTRTPQLTVSKIQARSVSVMAAAISQLEAAGLVFTDRGTQDDIRELLGLAPLPEAADAIGVKPADLEAALRSANLDPATLDSLLKQLPADIGITRNRVVPEGQLAGS